VTARPIAVVAGYVLRYPAGGMTWVFLQHLLGLRDLGFEPVLVEAAGPQPACYDPVLGRMVDDPVNGAAYLERALDAVGLGGTRWWWVDESGSSPSRGMADDEAVAVLEDAEVLLNVSGSCWASAFARCRRRVLVDTDAPFTQIRLADGDAGWTAFVDAHDVLATIAVGVADGTADVPATGRPWVATVPPIHLPSWPASPVPEGPWTTVTSWAAYGSTWWRLEEYRQKDVEYARLRDLPSRLPDGVRLELALGGDAPRRQLAELGWHLADPMAVAADPEAFAGYVRSSRAELSVAKQAYRRCRTGAFNDRSLCYLASGRPVVYSDTGVGSWLPTGEGLLTFDDAASAAAAIAAVEADPAAHGAAARRLASRFDASSVLAELLRAADVPLPATA
jgi:hypothetical protein